MQIILNARLWTENPLQHRRKNHLLRCRKINHFYAAPANLLLRSYRWTFCLQKAAEIFAGTIVCAAVLDSVIDYVVSFAEEEIRVQIQTSEAVKNDVLFQEGETAYMTFNTVLWFSNEEGEN